MHPVIDKIEFLGRCDKGAIDSENDFAALYFACLALAAITSPENDPKLTGFSPIQWANMYVDRSKKGTQGCEWELIFQHWEISSLSPLLRLYRLCYYWCVPIF
jgi:hypothetical protein